MTRPSPLWRAILWVERFLPAPRMPGVDASERRRGQAWMLVVLVPMMAVNLARVARDRAELAGGWPIWRATILDALLVAAGACLVAVIAAGVMGWRRAKRGADA